MRIAFYNQMFAMNGRRLLSFLYSHYLVHFSNNSKKIREIADISRTIEIIKYCKADIIGVAEVLDYQKKELKEKLKKLGYKYIYFARGHKTKYRKMYVEVMIASKTKCRKINVKGFPVKNEMGGGGGLIVCYFPWLACCVVNLHLASIKKQRKLNQLEFVKDITSKLDGKLILIGDFNNSYRNLKKYFKDFILASNRFKTCSITPIIKFLYNYDDDHILVKDFEIKKFGSLKGRSDHKLIYVDLK